MKWFFPAWNGDVRIERIPNTTDERAQILVYKPTEAEVLALRDLAKVLRAKGYLDVAAGLWHPGGPDHQVVELNATIMQATPLLMQALRKNAPTLHVAQAEDGSQTAADNTQSSERTEEVVAAVAEQPRARGVSVERPTPCCPDPIPGPIEPATEVLYAFLTPEQRKRYDKDRSLIVRGGRTGHAYVVAHRHSEWARRINEICYDATDHRPMHFHDWSVPPDEEVLATMLILQHRESWLRNEATALGGGYRSVFKNPFGDGLDGVSDSLLMSDVGRELRGLFGQRTGPVIRVRVGATWVSAP